MVIFMYEFIEYLNKHHAQRTQHTHDIYNTQYHTHIHSQAMTSHKQTTSVTIVYFSLYCIGLQWNIAMFSPWSIHFLSA